MSWRTGVESPRDPPLRASVWLKSGRVGKSQFGSVKAMTEHKGWEKRQTIYVTTMLKTLRDDLGKILEELQ